MNNLKRLYRLSILSYKALNSQLTLKNVLINKLILPILQISFFYFVNLYIGENKSSKDILMGNIVYFISYSSVMVFTFMLVRDKSFGTLRMVLASPIERVFILAARVIPMIVDGFIGIMIQLFALILIFRINITVLNLVNLILPFMIISISLCGVGIIFANIVLMLREPVGIINIFFLFLLLVSGANFNIERLPELLQWISNFIPIHYAVDSVRIIINEGVTNSAIYNLITCGCEGIIYYVIGIIQFYISERVFEKSSLN